MNADAESLISHLSCGLAPQDRQAFRNAAEAALASSSECWGAGLIHRTVVAIWRIYFHPPREDRDSGRKKPSKLVTESPRDGHVRRRVRIVR